jgi:hypothetical protein
MQGGSGADTIYTGLNQVRSGPDGYVDTVDCGSGYDTVRYEKGIDKIKSNCEKKLLY